jgi:hypothetical protein
LTGINAAATRRVLMRVLWRGRIHPVRLAELAIPNPELSCGRTISSDSTVKPDMELTSQRRTP